MDETSDNILELIGLDSKTVNLERAVKMWISGISLEDISVEVKIDITPLRIGMKKLIGLVLYQECKELSKQSRHDIKTGELRRITSLNRQQILDKLEENPELSIKERCGIEKVFGDRVAIADGEATVREDKTINIVSFAEAKKSDSE